MLGAIVQPGSDLLMSSVATRKAPPAPRSHWLWGNPEVLADPLAFMRRNSSEHGGIVSLRLLTHTAWLVTEPAAIESILIDQPEKFRKHFAVRLLPIALGNGLLTSEGDFYSRQRRLSQPAFQRSQISQYFSTFVNSIHRMLDSWQSGDDRDILQEMHTLTLGTASKTLFGVDAEAQSERVRAALRVGQAEFVRRLMTIFHFPIWVPTPSNLRLRRATQVLDDIIYDFIRQRRQATHNQRSDLLSILLHARDSVDQTGMTDKQLRDECLTIFLAGQETTALAMSWCWWLLSEHPAAAKRIYEEVDTVLNGRVPTVEDIPRLQETEYALLEAMRLYPPIYIIGREALVDTEIEGFHCPRGTTVLMPAWAVHRDARYFENPDAFLPERWRDGLEKRLPKCAYFPFSAGPRVCLGSHFAMLQMKLVIAMIAQKFRFTAAPGQKVRPNVQITLQPSPGVPAILAAREQTSHSDVNEINSYTAVEEASNGKQVS